MNKTAILMTFLLFSAVSVFAGAEKITLLDGEVITGTIIKEYDTKLVVRDIAGRRIIYKEDIKSRQAVKTTQEQYQELLKAKDLEKAADQIAIAKWCKKKHLLTSYFKHMNSAITLDPANREARLALGHVQYERRWVADNNEVKTERIWVTKKEKEALLLKDQEAAQAIKDNRAGIRMAKDSDAESPDGNAAPEALTPQERDYCLRYIRDLDANGWRKRQIAIKTLAGQTWSNKIPPLLHEVMRTGSEGARAGVIESLALMHHTPSIPMIEKKALQDKSFEVRMKAVYALGEMSGPRSVRALLKAMKDENEDVIMEAISALEKITFTTYDYLGTPNISEATRLFKNWHSKNAGKTRREVIITVLREGQGTDRVKAAEFLYKMGEEREALGGLIELLAHEDQQVQVDANRLLVDFSGEDFQFDPYTTADFLKEKWIGNWKAWLTKKFDTRAKPGKEYDKAVDGKNLLTTSDLVMALGRTGKEKTQARTQIRAMKKSFAIPLLIAGMNNKDVFIRGACFALLQEVSGQYDELGYSPNEESEAIRLTFIAKWESWYEENKEKFADTDG